MMGMESECPTWRNADEVYQEYLRGYPFPVEPPKLTKARKDHRCDVCGLQIVRGSRYRAETVYPGHNNDNDEIWVYRAHELCDHLWAMYGESLDWFIPARDDWDELLAEEHIINPYLVKEE